MRIQFSLRIRLLWWSDLGSGWFDSGVPPNVFKSFKNPQLKVPFQTRKIFWFARPVSSGQSRRFTYLVSQISLQWQRVPRQSGRISAGFSRWSPPAALAVSVNCWRRISIPRNSVSLKKPPRHRKNALRPLRWHGTKPTRNGRLTMQSASSPVWKIISFRQLVIYLSLCWKRSISRHCLKSSRIRAFWKSRPVPAATLQLYALRRSAGTDRKQPGAASGRRHRAAS